MHVPAVLVLMISTIFVTVANDLGRPSPLGDSKDIVRVLFKEQRQSYATFASSQAVLTSAMALLALGSSGLTREQIVQGLYLVDNDSFLSGSASAILKRALKVGNSSFWWDLHMSHAIYVRKGVQIQPKFKSLAESFDAHVFEEDFRNDLENTQKIINKNMDELTHHKILDILPEGTITEDSDLVLVSGVYFKGHWKHPFVSADNKTFPKSKTQTVPMMRVQGQFEMAVLSDGVQALRIPYMDEKFGLWVFLPNDSVEFTKFQAEFSNSTWAQAEANKKWSTVDVILPRFHVDFLYIYNPALEKLGIQDAFSKSANFSALAKMTSGPTLQLTSVVQKVVLEVSEEGGGDEASHSTKTVSGQLQQFWVNRSFVFAIVGDNAFAWPLFFGSYSTEEDPSSVVPSRNVPDSASASSPHFTMLVLLLAAVLVEIH